jgi:hypothetical protein
LLINNAQTGMVERAEYHPDMQSIADWDKHGDSLPSELEDKLLAARFIDYQVAEPDSISNEGMEEYLEDTGDI